MDSKALFDAAHEKLTNRQIGEAIELFRAAENAGYCADECSGGRWMCRMLEGRFELAWRESDLIAERRNPDPHRFWDGESLKGKRVLIRCLHGLGDTLQFIRYARSRSRDCAARHDRSAAETQSR